MAIKTKHDAPERLKPTETPLFASLLADMGRRDKPYPDPEWVPHFYASSAGKCARALSFHLRQADKRPIDDVGLHVMQIGTLVHAGIEEYLDANGLEGAANVEAEQHFELPDVHLTGYADLVIDWEDEESGEWVKEIVDWKTTAAYGFMAKTTREGPDPAHILQVGLAMRAFDADCGRIVYLAKEGMAKRDTKKQGWPDDDLRRVVTEFTFTAEEIAPAVDRELKRLARIWEMFEAGELAPMAIPNVMPAGARVTDPSTGAWALFVDVDGQPVEADADAGMLLDKGESWACRYCPYQETCTALLKTDDSLLDLLERSVAEVQG